MAVIVVSGSTQQLQHSEYVNENIGIGHRLRNSDITLCLATDTAQYSVVIQ